MRKGGGQGQEGEGNFSRRELRGIINFSFSPKRSPFERFWITFETWKGKEGNEKRKREKNREKKGKPRSFSSCQRR